MDVLNNLVSSPLQHEHNFWLRMSKCYGKTVKFYPAQSSMESQKHL